MLSRVNKGLWLILFSLIGLWGSVQAANLGNVTNFQNNGNGEFTFTTTGGDQTKVIFLKDDVFRIWVGPGGNFTDPANSDPARSTIIFKNDYVSPSINVSNQGAYYQFSTSKVVLRAYTSPLKFSLYEADNTTEIFSESSPINLGSTSTQTLSTSADEHFYGGGQQNGSFAHKGTNLQIVAGGWEEGDRPNPAPFLISSKGYGFLRNTFKTGNYDLRNSSTIKLNHGENRFDAYYFSGDYKQMINLYTELTGRPTFLGIWALELGDADCYNDDGVTSQVIAQVADKYREHDMPGGWILPNDGYGCGYTDLPYVVDQLEQRGFYTGLWTEDGVDQIAWEVGTAGTRVQKLDVAWTGAGYQHSLDANKAAWEGIQNNSDSRPFVWTVMGWAGTQRYAVAWTGDQYGSWDLIRWHIPTLIGSGMSGQAYATTDVDGIFGGDPETYTRDLQWKAFTPVLYAMNGWSNLRKSPWWYEEPYRSINRDYLKLKMRMTPYMYKYMKDASETGEPIVRGMLWEFPDDPVTWGHQYKYQYMLGESLLVAPVFHSMNVNDGIRQEPIYVPQGRFVDYWDGRYVDGPIEIDTYPITLEKTPVLVKAGAIIPMYPEMLFDGQLPKDPLTFDIYPFGNSDFTLYEDDGKTRQYETGEFSTQDVTVAAGTTSAADITVNVGPSVGYFEGKLITRKYEFDIHYPLKPLGVSDGTSNLTEYASKAELQNATSGWFYDANDRAGMVFVKLPTQSTSANAQIVLDIDEAQSLPAPIPYEAPPTSDPGKINPLPFVVSSPSAAQSGHDLSNAFDGTIGTIWHTSWGANTPTYPHEVIIDMASTHEVNKFVYTPREGGGNGTIAGYEIYVSQSDTDFGSPVASGTWANNGNPKEVTFTAKSGRYVKFRAVSEVNGNTWASAAEFAVYEVVTTPPNPGEYQYVRLVATSEINGNAWTSMSEFDVLSNGTPMDQSGWTLHYADSEQSGHPGTNAFDNDTSTMWHTQWSPTTDSIPHEIQINLGANTAISGFHYLPRQSGSSNGGIAGYEFYVSTDGQNWGTPVATGTFSSDTTEKQVDVDLTPPTGVPATISSPQAGTTFPNGDVTFTWTNDGLAENYQLMAGSTQTGNNYYYSGILAPSASSAVVTGLPTDGSTVHISVHTKINGAWEKNDYVYTAYTGPVSTGHRYVKLVATSEINGNPWTSLAELNVLVSGSPISQSGWTVHSVDSEETVGENGAASNAIDGNSATIWHTQWNGSSPTPPHEIQIDLGADHVLSGFRYLPRQDGGVNGTIAGYEFYLSSDGQNWGAPVATGNFASDTSEKQVNFN